jgi:hypothetical protein
MPEKSRRTRIVRSFLVLVLGTLVGTVLIVHLIGRAPRFYHEIEQLTDAQRAAESKQFVRRSAGIWNQIANEPNWSGTLSDRQVNAWLAEEFRDKHFGVLPRGVSDPRIAFEPGRLTLAFRKQFGSITALVSGSGRVWLPEPNVLALEVERVRAGSIPLPSGPVIELVTSAAASAGLDIEWQQYDGHPVAIVRLKASEKTSGLGIDRIEIQDGVLYAAGRSLQSGTTVRKNHQSADAVDVSVNVQTPDSDFQR